MNQQISLEELLKAAPKQFCDNINGGFNQETFLLAMFSGQTTTVFALTPTHMKQFIQWSKHQVDMYEKLHGEIKAEWNPNIVSPIKKADLKKSLEDNED